MLKSILNLKNLQQLSKTQQAKINGGGLSQCCNPALRCCNSNPAYNGNNCQYFNGTRHCV
jgi:hypothetical protein